jgi:hypothetical protein
MPVIASPKVVIPEWNKEQIDADLKAMEQQSKRNFEMQ